MSRLRITGTLRPTFRPRERVIAIREEPFSCGYDVTVEPPPEGIGHDRELPDHAAALRYAERLSAATGWRVPDQSEGEGGERG